MSTGNIKKEIIFRFKPAVWTRCCALAASLCKRNLCINGFCSEDCAAWDWSPQCRLITALWLQVCARGYISALRDSAVKAVLLQIQARGVDSLLCTGCKSVQVAFLHRGILQWRPLCFRFKPAVSTRYCASAASLCKWHFCIEGFCSGCRSASDSSPRCGLVTVHQLQVCASGISALRDSVVEAVLLQIQARSVDSLLCISCKSVQVAFLHWGIL
jgi:hypothetical protein